jgi:hypothetical protein
MLLKYVSSYMLHQVYLLNHYYIFLIIPFLLIKVINSYLIDYNNFNFIIRYANI